LTVGGVSIYEATATGATGAITAANIDGNAVAVTNATLVSGRGGLGDATV